MLPDDGNQSPSVWIEDGGRVRRDKLLVLIGAVEPDDMAEAAGISLPGSGREPLAADGGAGPAIVRAAATGDRDTTPAGGGALAFVVLLDPRSIPRSSADTA